jgi:hypothetical protein
MPASSTDPFFVGVNLPWLTYGCDFGANAWQPAGGVSALDRQRRLDEVFERLAAAGLRTVRWFVLCDGRAGLAIDADGEPAGVDDCFFPDLEAGLGLATRRGLSVVPVLFDFLWCARRREVKGVTLGGRRRWLADGDRRARLLDRVVRPILSRYGQEPAIHSWDLFNEPEWATLGYGRLNPAIALRPRTMRGVLGDLVALARSEARQPTTVGLASPRGLRLVKGLALGFVQLHWYDRRAPTLYPACAAPAGSLLGEFPTAASAHAPEAILAAARAMGYAGALGWSALATDRHSDLAALERALEARRPEEAD